MMKKRITYFIIVILLLSILVFRGVREFTYSIVGDFFYPFFSAGLLVKDSLSEKAKMTESRKSLVAQLFKMQKRLVELEAKTRTIDTLKSENDRLRNLLDIKPMPNYTYVISEVLYRDPTNWDDQFSINKGSNEGIKEGAIVLGEILDSKNGVKFGVIGRIGHVSKHTAIVYTLLNDECQISVAFPSNGATGITKGGGYDGNMFFVNVYFLPKNMKYELSSLLVTSGLTPLAPKGLDIGYLQENPDDNPWDDKLYIKAKVKLSVDLNHLNFILVLVQSND